MAKEISAGAVIFHRNADLRYLLLKYRYKSEYWDFPKGNVEKGEREEETVRREVKEETGMEDIKFVPGFKEKIFYFYRRGEETIFKQVTFYLVEALKTAVKISAEHVGFEWVSFETARSRLKQKSKEVLEKAHVFLTKGMKNFFE